MLTKFESDNVPAGGVKVLTRLADGDGEKQARHASARSVLAALNKPNS